MFIDSFKEKGIKSDIQNLQKGIKSDIVFSKKGIKTDSPSFYLLAKREGCKSIHFAPPIFTWTTLRLALLLMSSLL